MKIALTYDLRKEYLEMGFSEEETAEFDSEETIQALCSAIQSLGHEAVRVGNFYELATALQAGKRWDLVFNITEGLYGISREAQVPALLEAYNLNYTFSDPLTLALSLDKAMAKRVVRDAGLPTPLFSVIHSTEELEEFVPGNQPQVDFPVFLKPVAEGTGKGITPASIVRDIKTFQTQCKRLLARYGQPVLVEQYLPGDEYTVGILGTGRQARVAGVLQVELLRGAEPGVYSYMNKELCEERVRYSLVRNKKLLKEASSIALRAYNVLNCRDAGRVDLKADSNGELQFLEMNPLAGLHPTHSDLPILCAGAGIAYKDLIGQIIESAAARSHPDGRCHPVKMIDAKFWTSRRTSNLRLA